MKHKMPDALPVAQPIVSALKASQSTKGSLHNVISSESFSVALMLLAG